MILPQIHAWWEPHGGASFYFAELLATVPGFSDGRRAFHIIIISQTGDYMSDPLSV
jgi:hypothetical protein